MSNYAFKDKNRTIKIFAKDSIKENKDTRFYCPNPNCDAHMYICNVKGVSSAYFSANHKNYPHAYNCPFGVSNNFKVDDYDEKLFNFESALEALTFSEKQVTREIKTTNDHGVGGSRRKLLRTIRQIYDMCKSFDINDTYNEIKIGQMIVDDRSAYMYPKGVFGYKIIEGKVKMYFYDPQKLEIKILAPIGSERYSFILRFSDEKLFKDIKNIIFNNREKIIVVSGEWKSTDQYNYFFTKIINKKQIAIIKR